MPGRTSVSRSVSCCWRRRARFYECSALNALLELMDDYAAQGRDLAQS
jgi:hypothetical protein